MKKLILSLVMLLAMAGTAQAQFEAGTKYVGASVSGLNLQYNSSEHLRFGLNSKAGLFVTDGLMIYGDFGYTHTRHTDDLNAGVGGRFYFTQNGIFLGAGAEYCHETKSYNDVRIPVEIGYCFYINHYVSIEPSLYYNMSLNDFSDKSTVGLKIGFGLYF